MKIGHYPTEVEAKSDISISELFRDTDSIYSSVISDITTSDESLDHTSPAFITCPEDASSDNKLDRIIVVAITSPRLAYGLTLAKYCAGIDNEQCIIPAALPIYQISDSVYQQAKVEPQVNQSLFAAIKSIGLTDRFWIDRTIEIIMQRGQLSNGGIYYVPHIQHEYEIEALREAFPNVYHVKIERLDLLSVKSPFEEDLEAYDQYSLVISSITELPDAVDMVRRIVNRHLITLSPYLRELHTPGGDIW